MLFSFMRLVHYPEPISAIRLGLAPAHATPKLMPAHYIPPSANPQEWKTGSEELPATVVFDGRLMTTDEFFESTSTNAFLVIRNGVITYEWYKDGFTDKFQFPSYSVAKTLTSKIGRAHV